MPSGHSTVANGDRILDVAMTSGGVCIYTEALQNAFNGLTYIYDDVYCIWIIHAGWRYKLHKPINLEWNMSKWNKTESHQYLKKERVKK